MSALTFTTFVYAAVLIVLWHLCPWVFRILALKVAAIMFEDLLKGVTGNGSSEKT